MQLYDYQEVLVQQIYSSWNQGHQNVMAQLSTGGGKTVILSHIVAAHQGASVIIAHRTELVGQLSLTLARFGIKHNLIAPITTRREIVATHHNELQRGYYYPQSSCYVASVDTLLRLPSETPWFRKITLLVIDEAHHVLKDNKWGRACQLFPNARGLYPTATPVRADGFGLGRHADGLMDVLIQGPSMRDLINRGRLTDYRIFAPPSDLNLDDVNITASGDYSPERLRTAVHRSHITGDIVDHYLRIAPGKLGVTFAVDLKAAADIALAYRQAKIPAEVISSKTPPLLRQQLMRKFRNRELLQLVNVDILGEGVDVPAIEVISMGRPTESYTTFAQQFGRSLRTLENKTHAIIIDHVNNYARHGLPDSPRIWTLDRRERRARTTPEDVIPLKTCLKCMSVYTRFLRECPYCGHYAQPTRRTQPRYVDGDLCELDPETLAELRGEAERITLAPKIPYNADPIVERAVRNRHKERSNAQYMLQDSIARWAGIYHHQGASDSEIYRRFYFTFGIDILSAQGLARTPADLLNSKVIDETVKITTA